VRVGGLMMGVWFLSLSMGNWLAGRLAAFYGNMPPADLFRTLGILTLVTAVVLAAVARPVARMMREVQ